MKLPNTVIFSIQQLSISGTPDFIICCSGVFLALELKATAKSRVSKLQAYNLKKINDSKGVGMVVHPDNWKEALEFITELSLVHIYNGNSNDFSS